MVIFVCSILVVFLGFPCCGEISNNDTEHTTMLLYNFQYCKPISLVFQPCIFRHVATRSLQSGHLRFNIKGVDGHGHEAELCWVGLELADNQCHDKFYKTMKKIRYYCNIFVNGFCFMINEKVVIAMHTPASWCFVIRTPDLKMTT